MATPPTFVATYPTAFNSTTSPKNATGSITAAIGDVLVGGIVDEQDDNTENYTWTNTGGTGATYIEDTATGAGSSDVWTQTVHAVLASALTAGTLTATRTAGAAANWYGGLIAHFTGSAGIGNVAATAGAGGAAPSLAITTANDNSALLAVFGDFAAVDGTTRTWRTVNGFTPTAGNGQELLYFRDSAHYAAYIAYWPDAGAAGAKTVGLSAPAAMDMVGGVVEIRGTASAALPPIFVQPPRR